MDAKRDWGHARDYVEMQWLMLQQEKPEDFVIATGAQHSVRDFVVVAAKELGIQIRFEGTGVDEKGYWINSTDVSGQSNRANRRPIIAVDQRYFRPTEVETLFVSQRSQEQARLDTKDDVRRARRRDGAGRP